VELRAGYKRTETEAIPREWAVKRLGDIASLCKERVDPQADGTSGFCVELEHVEPGTGQLMGNTSVDSQASTKAVFRTGDVLFGKLRAYLRKYWLADREGVCSTEFWVLAANRQMVIPEFLFYLVTTEEFINMASMAYGTHMPRSDWNLAKNYRLALPGLEEQRAIASALSDVDALISSLDKLIAKKRDIKQAAMQQLLTGKRRLPGFCGEWVSRRIGDISDSSSGGTPLSSVSAYYGGSIPWVSISDMTSSGKYLVMTERSLTDEGLAASAAKVFPAGTVLYAMYASIGECSIAAIELCSSQAILGIRPRESCDGHYLYYWLVSKKDEVRAMGQHGTQANLNADMVKDFRVPLPTIDEQRAIANVLSDMDAEIEALERRRDKTRLLKQGMMQELLTGRVRLV